MYLLNIFVVVLTWFSAESVGVVETLLSYRYKRVRKDIHLFSEVLEILYSQMPCVIHFALSLSQ